MGSGTRMFKTTKSKRTNWLEYMMRAGNGWWMGAGATFVSCSLCFLRIFQNLSEIYKNVSLPMTIWGRCVVYLIFLKGSREWDITRFVEDSCLQRRAKTAWSSQSISTMQMKTTFLVYPGSCKWSSLIRRLPTARSCWHMWRGHLLCFLSLLGFQVFFSCNRN